ncbi:MAG: hypothetical protein K2K10_09780, partial [Acetatifactor sp.]|nr:hypothetical protein [Acetatifactor sp.]
MLRRPPRSTTINSSAASVGYNRKERMYEEALGERRQRLDRYITAFEAALKRGDHDEIRETREELNDVLEDEDD